MTRKVLAAAMMAAAVVLAGVAPSTEARQERLVRIAEQSGKLNDGQLIVDTLNARGSFGALRLYNRGAPVLINNVRVVYSDGSFHVEDRRIDLRKGERTKPIDAGRADKFVDRVIISYKPGPGASGPVILQVYGDQDARGAKAVRPPKSESKGSDKPVAAAPPSNPRAPSAPAAAAAPVAKRAVATTKAPSEGRCVGEGNVLLTRANVGFGTDRDRLVIPPSIGKFDRIRLCIFDNDIDLLDLKVTFAGGETLDLPYAGLIKAGHRTEGMSLRGDKFIEGIDITYKRREGSVGTAGVEIWGDLSEKWIDSDSELFNDGWVRLTSGNAVGFVGFETDISPVRTHSRGFKQVRLVVKDRDITLDYLDLKFADGTSQKISGDRKKIEPATGFGPVKIEGGPKIIKEVEARYRSRFFDRNATGNDRATVEIWGKR
ncbi:MAG: hypothetical protein ACK4MF_05095 [Hyphomicrobiaceae bacterium]